MYARTGIHFIRAAVAKIPEEPQAWGDGFLCMGQHTSERQQHGKNLLFHRASTLKRVGLSHAKRNGSTHCKFDYSPAPQRATVSTHRTQGFSLVSFFKHRSSPKGTAESRFAPVPPPDPEGQQRKDVQRELILVVIKNTLHRLGIPHDWLAYEVITVTHGPDQEKLHIQLMLMKWHETLLRYTPALEQQLLRSLLRIDPTVQASQYVFSWRFSPDCGCPFLVMPPPNVWGHDGEPATSDTPPPEEDDYERTQLSPLR